MTALLPPCITPPDTVRPTFSLLRQTAENIVTTWPWAMYHQPSHPAPIKGLTYFMQPDAVTEVLLNRDGAFDQSTLTRRILRPIWRSGLTVAEGERWRAQRRAAAPVFTPASVEAIIPVAQTVGSALCATWENGPGTVEVTKPLGDAAQRVVMESLLGDLLNAAEMQRLQRSGARLISEMNRINYADLLFLPEWTRRFLGPTFHATAKVLHDQLARTLPNLKAANSVDAPLLTRLVTATDPETGQGLSIAQIRDNIVGFLGAGRETTALSIAWTLMLLAHDPRSQEKVREEVSALGALTPQSLTQLSFTRACFLEAMRLYPPAPQIVRDCLKDTELAGVHLRKGDVVNLPIYVIHRHRALWDEPDAFRPERFAALDSTAKELRGRYLPFGGGAHICLGQAFAMTEVLVLLAQIVQRFDIALPRGFSLQFETGASLRPRGGLHLQLTPRG